MLSLKKGVDIDGVKPETLLAMFIANEVYQKFNSDLRITSCKDGKHIAKSKHYMGYAFDCGVKKITKEIMEKVVALLKTNLNVNYDVVLEEDHIHIEYDPK